MMFGKEKEAYIKQIIIMYTTEDIKNQLKEKFQNGEFRITKNGVKTVELQNVQFICDKDHILREPNYDYAQREVEWYKSQSLNVNDIPGGAPVIWKQCADILGYINSNYGWMIWSDENGSQYKNCLKHLVDDPVTREATMIYNRPSMHTDAVSRNKHDFCCTYSVQCFLNETENGYSLKYIVYMRSNDAVFGFNNDYYWHAYVQNQLAADLRKELKCEITCEPIIWHAGSFHVYERHFNLLSE